MHISNQVTISIVIPVYNVRSYIDECIFSLVNQTLPDIQLIIVDNGCEDDSMSIVEKYIESRNNVSIVKLEKNVGLAKARNIGMKSAVGEFIAFVDSDDVCDLTMFEKMYKQAKALNADVTVCNVATFTTDTKYAKSHHYSYWYQETEKTFPIEGHPEQWMEMAAWAKLSKRSYINSVEYSFTPGSLCCEDVPGATKLFLNTDKIASVNECLYFYRNRPDSLSKKTSFKFASDFSWAMRQQDILLDQRGIYDNANLYYIFLVRILLANHILTHMENSEFKRSFYEIANAFHRFDNDFINKACVYNLFHKKLVTAILDGNVRKYKRLIKGINK